MARRDAGYLDWREDRDGSLRNGGIEVAEEDSAELLRVATGLVVLEDASRDVYLGLIPRKRIRPA